MLTPMAKSHWTQIPWKLRSASAFFSEGWPFALFLYLPSSGRGLGRFTSWPSCFILFLSSRWTSGDAPLPAHPLPETASVSWRPPTSAVHRLLPGPIGGAEMASQWPHCDHAGGPGCLRGGNPASRLLPADQVHSKERGGGGREGGREMKGGRMDGGMWAESWLAVDWPVALTHTLPRMFLSPPKQIKWKYTRN